MNEQTLLTLEESLSLRLLDTWQPIKGRIIVSLVQAIEQDDYEAVNAAVARIKLERSTEGNYDYIKQIGRGAVLFGSSRLTDGEPDDTRALEEPGTKSTVARSSSQVSMVLKDASVKVRRVVEQHAFTELENRRIGKMQKDITTLAEGLGGKFASGESSINLAASLHTSRLATYGFCVEATLLQVVTCTNNEVLDSRTCPVCEFMDQTVLSVEKIFTQVKKAFEATTVEELKRAAPWPGQSKAALTELTSMTTAEIQELGYYPPFHPLCFSDDTEVYTSSGWKLFKNVGELDTLEFLSLTKFREIEWVKAIKSVSYPFTGDMKRFKSYCYDSLVTPDHRIPSSTKADKVLTLKPADEFSQNCCRVLPRTGIWNGHALDAPFGYDTKDFAAFMGIYLSEGNASAKKKHFEISQYKVAPYAKITMLMNKVFGEEYVKTGTEGKISVYRLHDVALYLATFGHSSEKTIPEWIMLNTPDIIREFLTWFVMGDGCIRERKNKLTSSKSTVISTSSEIMAGQLGELILKTGGYPNYSLVPAGKPYNCPKSGNTYYSNHSQHYISWNTAKNAYIQRKGVTISDEHYSGMVYDVELEKNHILFVRRNGKTCFSGNCRGFLDFNKSGQQLVDTVTTPSSIPGMGDITPPTLAQSEQRIRNSVIPRTGAVSLDGINDVSVAAQIAETLEQNVQKYGKQVHNVQTVSRGKFLTRMNYDATDKRFTLNVNKTALNKLGDKTAVDAMYAAGAGDGVMLARNLDEAVTHDYGVRSVTVKALATGDLSVTYPGVSQLADEGLIESGGELFLKRAVSTLDAGETAFLAALL